MAITPVDKIKIMNFFKRNPIGEIYYLDLCDALGKRGKISDIEFLEFFVDALVKEFKKEEKISIKQVSKLVVTIESFLEWVHQAGSEIKEETLDKIRNFEEYYDDYLNRTGFDIDLEFTEGYLASLINAVNTWYPTDEKNESVVQYLNEIEELRVKLSNLNREYENLSKLYDDMKTKYDKKQEAYVGKSNEFNSALSTIESLRDDVSRLEGRILELSGQIEDLNVDLDTSANTIEILLPYKEECTELSRLVEELRESIREKQEAEDLARAKEMTDLVLESLVYEFLLKNSHSVQDIIANLKNLGYTVSKDEVFGLLKRLQQKVKVSTGTFSVRPNYMILPPTVIENGNFDIHIPMGCKSYDILLVSDFHIRSMDFKTIEGMEKINNYCINNGIHLVINLGDLFDCLGGNNTVLKDAMSNYKLVEDAISLIPKADGIYHAVIGGNHDMKNFKYGFDPITMIANEREDFINLGYSHNLITFNGSKSILSCFGIHHPQTYDFPISLSSADVDSSNLLDSTLEFYQSHGITRDDSFIDIFGHTHRSLFNFPESYCYIPAFFNGTNRGGACHMKVFFDEEREIKYMVFMPLIVRDKLTRNTEILYQKVLSK